jgi:hypothetical protein
MEHETAIPELPGTTLIEHLATRLAAAVEALERALPRASESIGPIVEAEQTIATLRASATQQEGRRTLPVSLIAKQQEGSAEPAALDAALCSLSLEQRIAVKAQLLRAGLV